MILLGMFGGPEIIVIVFVVLLLFGAKQIPELMRGLGKGIREFKEATNADEIRKDLNEVSGEISSAADEASKKDSANNERKAAAKS